ncbi:MAG: hypothetical protein A3K19_08950 [Lentisphaerae bacterium RIFOXYB12_FULL_65_16]|nr:MAG: hypothetical protein A3K18_13675 [Lentisphaerae bacterium RIFOXYA12_64_32]OGV87675.1 MAG: hypothetical protein A3K19_08950 [Lentisphaerae bacterium RIFOXYB12_FULL_65_16]
MNSAHTIPALGKAVLLMEYLGRSDGGATQAELARELGISTSTCYRIIQTLGKHDWLRKVPGNRYDLSGGILSATMKLVQYLARYEQCQPLLNRLAATTGLSTKLSIRQGNEQVTVLRAESPRPLSVSGKVGARFPVIEGSVGAALLSSSSAADIRQLAETCGEDIAEKGDPEIVMARVESIRCRGYCLNSKHNRWRIDAMSAPLTDVNGQVVAALTLLGMNEDFSEGNTESLASRLLAAARKCRELV